MNHDEEPTEGPGDDEGVDDALETIFRIMSKRMGIPSKAEELPKEGDDEIQPALHKDDSELNQVGESSDFLRPLLDEEGPVAPTKPKGRVTIVIGKGGGNAGPG